MCTPSGYLKHLNDSYPPTGMEHSLLSCRECLILKPPFWKNKTWYHRNGTTSSLSLFIRKKVCLFSWPCFFRLSLSCKVQFIILGSFSSPANPTSCRTRWMNVPPPPPAPYRKWSLVQSQGKLGGAVSVISWVVRSWRRWLSAALREILHTTPAEEEAWKLTHYTNSCRGLKAAHRAVEFYTEALLTAMLMFQPCWFGRNWENKRIFWQSWCRESWPTILTCICLCLFFIICVYFCMFSVA